MACTAVRTPTDSSLSLDSYGSIYFLQSETSPSNAYQLYRDTIDNKVESDADYYGGKLHCLSLKDPLLSEGVSNYADLDFSVSSMGIDTSCSSMASDEFLDNTSPLNHTSKEHYLSTVGLHIVDSFEFESILELRDIVSMKNSVVEWPSSPSKRMCITKTENSCALIKCEHHETENFVLALKSEDESDSDQFSISSSSVDSLYSPTHATARREISTRRTKAWKTAKAFKKPRKPRSQKPKPIATNDLPAISKLGEDFLDIQPNLVEELWTKFEDFLNAEESSFERNNRRPLLNNKNLILFVFDISEEKVHIASVAELRAAVGSHNYDKFLKPIRRAKQQRDFAREKQTKDEETGARRCRRSRGNVH